MPLQEEATLQMRVARSATIWWRFATTTYRPLWPGFHVPAVRAISHKTSSSSTFLYLHGLDRFPDTPTFLYLEALDMFPDTPTFSCL